MPSPEHDAGAEAGRSRHAGGHRAAARPGGPQVPARARSAPRTDGGARRQSPHPRDRRSAPVRLHLDLLRLAGPGQLPRPPAGPPAALQVPAPRLRGPRPQRAGSEAQGGPRAHRQAPRPVAGRAIRGARGPRPRLRARRRGRRLRPGPVGPAAQHAARRVRAHHPGGPGGRGAPDLRSRPALRRHAGPGRPPVRGACRGGSQVGGARRRHGAGAAGTRSGARGLAQQVPARHRADPRRRDDQSAEAPAAALPAQPAARCRARGSGSGSRRGSICARSASKRGGSERCSPSASGASSVAKPGPMVASSKSTPLGTRK